MIRILLENVPFEADIREIMQAYYPGESFEYGSCAMTRNDIGTNADAAGCRTAEDDAEGIPESSDGTDTGKNAENASVRITGVRDGENYRFQVDFFKDDEMCRFTSGIFDSRFDTKSDLKRQLYRCLSEHEGRALPWGTLTGIRPTKLAMQGYDFEKEFLTSAEKTRLCYETAGREKTLLETADLENGWSLYIGIPFCPTRCAYCSFTAYPIAQWQDRKSEYIDALIKELRAAAGLMSGRKLQSIYMGGGTPTSLEADDLRRIIDGVNVLFDLCNLKEFTVEAGRPDSITREKLELLKAEGVTRISINPQTMNQKTLDVIGRRHLTADVTDRFMLARECGFDDINMDIIAGLPGEGISDFTHTLDELERLGPDAITVHCLAIKRAARLNRERENYFSDAEDVVSRAGCISQMIETSRQRCEAMGLKPYYLYRQKNMEGNFENVGYAREGRECLYNVLIMEEAQPIIGCGAGSTSKIPVAAGVKRFENVKDPQVYIERIDTVIEKKREVGLWL